MKCTYAKTYTGSCDQTVMNESGLCYYHTKVSKELIDSDPILSMRQSPTIRLS
jgi:hypothetical protein